MFKQTPNFTFLIDLNRIRSQLIVVSNAQAWNLCLHSITIQPQLSLDYYIDDDRLHLRGVIWAPSSATARGVIPLLFSLFKIRKEMISPSILKLPILAAVRQVILYASPHLYI